MERYINYQNRYRENRKINRAIFIPPENSKTGKGRHIVAPVADTLERMRKMYKDNGINCDRDDYIFPNLAKTKRNQNIPYKTPAIEKRLQKVIEISGLKEKLDKTDRDYSIFCAALLCYRCFDAKSWYLYACFKYGNKHSIHKFHIFSYHNYDEERGNHAPGAGLSRSIRKRKAEKAE